MLKKIKIRIEGMHCLSCKTLIETEVDVLAGVTKVNANYSTGKCDIEYDDQIIDQKKIFSTIEKLNYSVQTNQSSHQKIKKNYHNLIIAGGLLVIFAVGYFTIKSLGLLEILSKLNEENIGYGLLFLIGILTSFHCIGMCGGLVVTYTAKHQADNPEKKSTRSLPHWQYNLGRFTSYTVIGGILGGLGSFFGINPTFTGIVTLIAGGFMIIMGLGLATNFTMLKKIKIKMPSFVARYLYSQRHTKKPKGPFIIGLLNGFMPCGPLQAIQLYALASGSFIKGALSMAAFSLGTIPLMFGFGNFISIISRDRIKQIMKFSGVVVVILGLFMLNRGLTNFGLGAKQLVPSNQVSKSEYLVQGEISEYQVANMDLTYNGYEPNVLYVEVDKPVRWVINVKQMSGCTDAIIMPEYDIDRDLVMGENIIEFTPTKTGEVKFSCWMQMVWGKFIVN